MRSGMIQRVCLCLCLCLCLSPVSSAGPFPRSTIIVNSVVGPQGDTGAQGVKGDTGDAKWTGDTGTQLYVLNTNVAIGSNIANDSLVIGAISTATVNQRATLRFTNNGLGAPTNYGAKSTGDKIIFWTDSSSMRYAVGANSFEGWTMCQGTNGTMGGFITFYTETTTTAIRERMRITGYGYVGIDSSIPVHKLTVKGGRISTDSDFYASESTGGFVTKSVNGTCWRLVVSDAGIMTPDSIVCPRK